MVPDPERINLGIRRSIIEVPLRNSTQAKIQKHIALQYVRDKKLKKKNLPTFSPPKKCTLIHSGQQVHVLVQTSHKIRHIYLKVKKVVQKNKKKCTFIPLNKIHMQFMKALCKKKKWTAYRNLRLMEPETALLISPNHVLLGLQKEDTHFWVEEHVTLKRHPIVGPCHHHGYNKEDFVRV